MFPKETSVVHQACEGQNIQAQLLKIPLALGC